MTKKTKSISVTNQIALLSEAVKCSDPRAARLLVIRAFDVINCDPPDHLFGEGTKRVDDAAIDSVIALIKGVNPTDTVEMVLACQFVSCHFHGLIKLGEGSTSHGMMLTRLSHQALETLEKYRNKGSNINVSYYIKNEGNALLQTNIGTKIDGNLKKKGL